MICPNCKVKLNKDSKYCPRCGTLFKSDDVEKYSNMFDTDLLEIYFPHNEIGIHFDRISFGYMFFGGFYAMYKKLYYVGINSLVSLFIFIKVAINSYDYIMSTVGFSFFLVVALLLFPIIIYFYYLFKFNDLLIEDRKTRLNKIVRSNIDKGNEEIVKLVEKDSKNSVVALLISIILLIIFLLIF